MHLGGAGACAPAWGGPCAGSAAAPLRSPRYCTFCSRTVPLQTPGGSRARPRYSSGRPSPAEAQEEAAAASTVAQAADPLCPSGPIPCVWPVFGVGCWGIYSRSSSPYTLDHCAA